jgi:hypothetical protein
LTSKLASVTISITVKEQQTLKDTNLQIQIVNIDVTTKPTAKGSYQMNEVTYKNLSFQGKTETKKIMSFSKVEGEVFKVLANAAKGDVYDIERVKGEQYWEWTTAVKSGTETSAVGTVVSQAVGNSSQQSATPAPRGNWETPEERARKQVYIIRQSTLNVASTILTTGAKVPPKFEEVVGLAKQFEDYVLRGNDSTEEVKKDITTMDEDIPF